MSQSITIPSDTSPKVSDMKYSLQAVNMHNTYSEAQ